MIDYTLPLDELPDPLPIEPLTRPFDVTITPPGSKSITCRAYVLAALAKGESKIIRPLRAEDTDLLLDALCTLGAEARWDGDDVIITGVNGRFPRGGSINLNDGGTPTRFMIAAACLAAEPVVVDGSKRMRERPIAEGVDMLRQLGAQIEYVEEEGRLPVRVVPSENFKGGELTIGKTASSQFVSAAMLIAPLLEFGCRIRFGRETTSRSYIQLTGNLLRSFGVSFGDFMYSNGSPKEYRFTTQKIAPGEFRVFADASGASYWLLAVAILDESTMRLKPFSPHLPSMPSQGHRFGQPDLGVFVALSDANAVVLDFAGALIIKSTDQRQAVDLDCSEMPDGALSLAAYCCQLNARSCLTGLRTLRVKETDRIAALANELRKVGCKVETTDDSITITPVTNEHRRDACATGEHGGREARLPQPVIIETYNDHRMAMAFAVLGLARPGGHTLAIRNPACVKKSYPTFWKDFAKLYTSPGPN